MRVVVTALMVLLVAAACGESHAKQSNELVLGAIYPLSGSQGAGGNEELAGVKAALQLAESSGALKVPVRLDVVDANTPQAAAAAVDHLVRDDHVPAILGTYGSTLSAAAAARAEGLKTVYWETGAVADPITAQRHYVFRTVATGGALGRMAVTFTHDVLIPDYKLQAPRVAIIRVNDIYGRSVGGGEQAMASSLGIDVVDVIDYDPRAYDAPAIATRVAADHPDFLWDVSYLDDGVAIWQALLSQGRELSRRRRRHLAGAAQPARRGEGGGRDQLGVLHARVRSAAGRRRGRRVCGRQARRRYQLFGAVTGGASTARKGALCLCARQRWGIDVDSGGGRFRRGLDLVSRTPRPDARHRDIRVHSPGRSER